MSKDKLNSNENQIKNIDGNIEKPEKPYILVPVWVLVGFPVGYLFGMGLGYLILKFFM